jgi:hypothetical protein
MKKEKNDFKEDEDEDEENRIVFWKIFSGKIKRNSSKNEKKNKSRNNLKKN